LQQVVQQKSALGSNNELPHQVTTSPAYRIGGFLLREQAAGSHLIVAMY